MAVIRTKHIICIISTFACLLVALWWLRKPLFSEGFTDASPGTIYFVTNGRLGNNIFQYFAAELLRKIYNLSSVQYVDNLNFGSAKTVIDDMKYIEILEQYNNGYKVTIDLDKPIVLDGYFQRSDLLTPHRVYLKQLFTPENCTSINSKYRVCDIVKHVPKHYADYDPDQDLVMHMRLDDFKTHYLGGVFKSSDIKNKILKNIKYRKLFIVCDTLKQDWEKEYMAEYADLNPRLTDGSMLDDYKFLQNAKRLLISQSTFCWTAGFLGNTSEVHIPLHPNMGPHTNFYLGCYSPNCTAYNNIELIRQ